MKRRLYHLRLWGPARDEGIEWEIRHHLEERMDELRAQGLSEGEAEREARRSFGDERAVRRDLRRIDRGLAARRRLALLWETVVQDVRYALRAIGRNPGFAAALVLTLALGIGANGALFSVADALLLRPLPYAAPQELVQVFRASPNGGMPVHSRDFARLLLERQTALPLLFAHARHGGVIYGSAAEPMRVTAEAVTASFHATLGVSPALGRGFATEDMRVGAARVALVSWSFWSTVLGGDSGAIGRDVVLNGRPHTIIGVMPRGFKFPEYSTTEFWVPLDDEMNWLERSRQQIYLLGRVPGDLAVAEAALASVGNPLIRELTPAAEATVELRRLQEQRARGVGLRDSVRLLAGAMALILLVAGVNMVNLLLLRGAARTRELAVRLSLGASRRRLVRQLATEAMLMALLSGAVATLFAFGALRVLQGMMPQSILFFAPHAIELEARTLTFTFLLAVLSGLVFGLLPAFRATRLTSAGAGLATQAAPAAGSQRLRRVLVASEVGIAVTLLVGAGLLITSFVRLMQVDPGMQLERLAVLEVAVSSRDYPERAARVDYLRTLQQRIAALPGVEAVTQTGGIPPRGGGFQIVMGFETDDGREFTTDEPQLLPFTYVRPDFFDVTGARLLAGRAFTTADTYASGNVIISRSLADHLWPGENAIGRRFRTAGFQPWNTVIGIAADVRLLGPDERRARFAMLQPIDDTEDMQAGVFAIRTAGDPRDILRPVREAVHAHNPNQIIDKLNTARTFYADSLDMQRFLYLVITTMAILALVLSAVGIYGLLSYGVTRRQREIGVRVALGARSGDVQRLVLGEALALTALGIGAGVLGALATARFIRAALYGVETGDPRTFAAVIVTVLLSAALAALLPARRATRVDPAVVLRSD